MYNASSASIWMIAKSDRGSTTIIEASYSFLLYSITLILSAPSITWLLVIIYPSLSIITPDPRDSPFLLNSGKKSSKNGSLKMD